MDDNYIIIGMVTRVGKHHVSPIEDDIYSEPQCVYVDAFPTLNGERSYIQHVLFKYKSITHIYRKSMPNQTDMDDRQKYNGEI